MRSGSIRSSAQTLAFVARRLRAERVALVFGVREPSDGGRAFDGLPELRVGGLGEGDARALLDSVITGPLDERVRERIVAETRGNPLALLEMPRGLTPDELAGGFGLPGRSALSGRIEESFRTAVDDSAGGDAAAAAGRGRRAVGDPVLVRRAAERLGVEIAAAAPAAAAGLVELGALRALPPSARAVRGLPRGVGEGAADRASRRWRRRPIRRRSRSPRLAPCPGDAGARRGGGG